MMPEPKRRNDLDEVEARAAALQEKMAARRIGRADDRSKNDAGPEATKRSGRGRGAGRGAAGKEGAPTNRPGRRQGGAPAVGAASFAPPTVAGAERFGPPRHRPSVRPGETPTAA